MQVWSDKKYKSIEHQVVVKESKDGSLFLFCWVPRRPQTFGPVPEVLHGELPKYSHYNYGNFLSNRTAGNMEQLGRNLQIDDYEINN